MVELKKLVKEFGSKELDSVLLQIITQDLKPGYMLFTELPQDLK
jgi:hypothetical protein